MYAQDYSFYKRPDTRLTPQQLESARVACCLAPVKVLERKPLVRRAAECTNAQTLLAAAPELFRNAIRKGLAVVHKEIPMSHIPAKGCRKFTLAHRRKISAALKQQPLTK